VKEEVLLLLSEDIGFAVGVSQGFKILQAFHVNSEDGLQGGPVLNFDYLNQFSSSPLLLRHFASPQGPGRSRLHD